MRMCHEVAMMGSEGWVQQMVPSSEVWDDTRSSLFSSDHAWIFSLNLSADRLTLEYSPSRNDHLAVYWNQHCGHVKGPDDEVTKK